MVADTSEQSDTGEQKHCVSLTQVIKCIIGISLTQVIKC